MKKKDDIVTEELKVPYSPLGSEYGFQELEAIARAWQDENFTMGPLTKEFETKFADYIGTRYAIPTTSCTTALYLITYYIGLKPGDEVITTPITFIATSLPLLHYGARPIFADIDPRTFNIDPQSVKKKISKKTRAIYVVHYGGQMVDMDPIMDLAKRHDLYVVEDCAHAPGAEYKGRKAGSIGHFGAFSFHSMKNITTLGEGGMVTTNDEQSFEKMDLLRRMGVTKKAYEGRQDYWLPYHYDVVDIDGKIGTNSRMGESQAAVGLAQLKKLDQLNAKRKKIARYLNEELKDIEGLTTTYEDPNCKHVYHLYTLLFDSQKIGATKDEFIRRLYRGYGIQPIIHYLPNYLFTIYKKRGYQRGICPVAEKIFKQLVNLPIYPRLTEEQLEIMVNSVRETISCLSQGK